MIYTTISWLIVDIIIIYVVGIYGANGIVALFNLLLNEFGFVLGLVHFVLYVGFF